ncbi:hypothetical protein QDR37_11180 [Amnibacterium sp. CER49]|uniref:BPSS1187 family protein n=1 Tax=Amnibacterium sp. CER49 TaxID=3039161 RepID=UPI00244AF854|nr:hypothetical protein [Amnibacterium sp. CER49]MDH2444507.1 hypothetical protein [Amnibacterium sp. CER49]
MRRGARRLVLVLLAAALVVVVAAGATAVWYAGTHPAQAQGPTASTSPTTPAGSHWFKLTGRDGKPLDPDRSTYGARTTASGPLLLFLAATGLRPKNYERFLTAATQAGYHVLGLDYYNLGPAPSDACGADQACYGRLEQNRFDGSAPSKVSAVTPRNGVLARLGAALDHLEQIDPKGGWDHYRTRGAIGWSDVVVAGHSQGGGEAAWIAHEHRVTGVLLVGAPILTNGTGVATWTGTPGKTPVGRYVAFDNTADGYYSQIRASWQALGLGTPRTVSPNDRLSGRLLLVDEPMRDAHIKLADDSTPLTADGTPRYLPIWRWMLDRFAPRA